MPIPTTTTTTATAHTTLPARLTGGQTERKVEAALIVDDHGEDVLVRFKLGRPWRCADCGPMERAECVHTFAAALVLAEQFLGLTPLNPREGE